VPLRFTALPDRSVDERLGAIGSSSAQLAMVQVAGSLYAFSVRDFIPMPLNSDAV
jgi:hypothetical protein